METKNEHLQRVPDDIMDLASTDPTVYAGLQFIAVGDSNYTTVLERLVVTLAREKHAFKQQALDLAMRDAGPIYFDRKDLNDEREE